MKRLALIALLALISVGCATNGGTKAEPKQETAAAEDSGLKGGPFPATEVKAFKVYPTIGTNVLNGQGWTVGTSKGSTFFFKGDEMAVDTPSGFTNKDRALTFKVLSFDAETGYMLTKVDGTEAFGDGGLNHFWANTPYANVKVVMGEDGKTLQLKFGEPVAKTSQVDQPTLPADAPVFKLQ